MPYRLVGGVNFYQRKRNQGCTVLFKTIANGQDDLAVQRIINVPKRGIGAASIGKITAWASEQGMSFTMPVPERRPYRTGKGRRQGGCVYQSD